MPFIGEEDAPRLDDIPFKSSDMYDVVERGDTIFHVRRDLREQFACRSHISLLYHTSACVSNENIISASDITKVRTYISFASVKSVVFVSDSTLIAIITTWNKVFKQLRSAALMVSLTKYGVSFLLGSCPWQPSTGLEVRGQFLLKC